MSYFDQTLAADEIPGIACAGLCPLGESLGPPKFLPEYTTTVMLFDNLQFDPERSLLPFFSQALDSHFWAIAQHSTIALDS